MELVKLAATKHGDVRLYPKGMGSAKVDAHHNNGMIPTENFSLLVDVVSQLTCRWKDIFHLILITALLNLEENSTTCLGFLFRSLHKVAC